MKKLMRIVVLGLALATLFGGIIETIPDAKADNGYGQMVLATDGCIYYWDSYASAYTYSFCLRADGWFNAYHMNNGQWEYIFMYVEEGFGNRSAVMANGTYIYRYANGYEEYTYPDGTHGSNMTEAQLQILNTIATANNRGLAIVTAPACTYSYNGC